ncbi:helix-turn-helix domain-containing protein [Embleya sp. NBC_00896]|uniref:helix-turn-helix domain-containing protein n=1 Tax=Embleya sp. NBC_00896 TaxID=2975961 RepID=UPI00386A3643|nr:AraC family transcriptional regulator [Embleya sp. NBC_00896]
MNGDENVGESAIWTRIQGVQDAPLDLMTARFRRHRYAPHAHEEFAIGVCVEGIEQIQYRGVVHRSGPGSVVVAEPGETHTGGPGIPEGYAYRVFYPSPELVGEDLLGPAPHFPSLVVADPGLAAEMVAVHVHLTAGGDAFEGESRVVEVLRALVGRHAVRGQVADRGSPDAARVARAVRERLADQLVAPPSLTELSAGIGLSRYQTLRAFRDVEGLPPYAWLAQHRVARAKVLLAAGRTPAQAALAVGFADQAHLGRWFRRVLGVTPGVYRNSVLDRQASRS